MGYTAWKIWLHPRATASLLNSMEESVAAAGRLQAELDASREKAADLETRLTSSEAELDARDGQLASFREKYDSATAENADLRNLLRHARATQKEAEEEVCRLQEIETNLREFQKMLSNIESMKAGYERRISKLRDLVKTLKSQQGIDDGHSAELQPIAFSTPPQAATSPTSPTTVTPPSAPTPDDWLLPLPD